MAKYPRLLAMIASTTLLVSAAGAQAATLVTPPAVLDDATAYCMLVNAGTAAIQVTSTVRNGSGGDAGGGTSCPTPPATLDPGATCWTMLVMGGQMPVHCRFTSSSSKVRGSLVIRDASGAFTTNVPATK
jgi:hypothetical protein